MSTRAAVPRGPAARLTLPAIIGFVLMVPFMVLEVVNRRRFEEGFPWPLFGFLWVLPAAFVVVAAPIVQSLRAGEDVWTRPVVLGLRIAALTLIAWFWSSLVLDQMPCFLGVENCD